MRVCIDNIVQLLVCSCAHTHICCCCCCYCLLFAISIRIHTHIIEPTAKYTYIPIGPCVWFRSSQQHIRKCVQNEIWQQCITDDDGDNSDRDIFTITYTCTVRVHRMSSRAVHRCRRRQHFKKRSNLYIANIYQTD